MLDDLTRRFTVDGVTLHWDRWGTPSGVPFVLCHGFSGSAHDFALNIEALAPDREVLAIDHRGHGRSEKLGAVDHYSIDRIADDVIAFIDTEVGGPVDVLGHSMGGSIALRVTLARPDLVRSLILMDTSAWSFIPPDSAIAELMGGFIRAYDPAGGLPDLSAFENAEDALIASATTAEWQALKEQMAAAFDPYALKALGTELFAEGTQWIRDRLGTITCPVRVIVGEHDHPFVDQAPELARETGDGLLAVIPGAYHSPQLTHPAEWLAAVQAHFAGR
jgi:pimeloyl-ACP methyl ester carboxylesterase